MSKMPIRPSVLLKILGCLYKSKENIRSKAQEECDRTGRKIVGFFMSENIYVFVV